MFKLRKGKKKYYDLPDYSSRVKYRVPRSTRPSSRLEMDYETERRPERSRAMVEYDSDPRATEPRRFTLMTDSAARARRDAMFNELNSRRAYDTPMRDTISKRGRTSSISAYEDFKRRAAPWNPTNSIAAARFPSNLRLERARAFRASMYGAASQTKPLTNIRSDPQWQRKNSRGMSVPVTEGRVTVGKRNRDNELANQLGGRLHFEFDEIETSLPNIDSPQRPMALFHEAMQEDIDLPPNDGDGGGPEGEDGTAE